LERRFSQAFSSTDIQANKFGFFMFVSPTRLSSSVIRVLPRKRMSRALGSLAMIDPPRPLIRGAIKLFCNAYGVDLSEVETPVNGYSSFDAFFTRRLKPDARPINRDANAIVSPADGMVQATGHITQGSTLTVKGTTYELPELLGDWAQARKYESGAYVVIYLSPRDYHRVHAPVDGRVDSLRYLGGTLFPVNEIGLRYISGLFARNERVTIYQLSPRFGEVATIMVGALGVGRISVTFDSSVVTNKQCTPGVRFYHQQAINIERGAELGAFHLGSTVVLLLPSILPITLLKRVGEFVRVGEAIARTGDA
jgi:phosphatidylserine decarboxylase